MTEFINRLTGGRMWVADNRIEEYKAAGHRLAASLEAEKPTEEPEKPKRAAKRAKKDGNSR